MQLSVDILAADQENRPIAVFEIKNLEDLSPSHGANRDAYMRLNAGGAVPYFFLVSQDKGFVWRPGDASPTPFDTSLVIRRYFPTLAPEKRIYGETLASLISYWLSGLAAGLRGAEQEPEKTLSKIGFLAAIREAKVYSDSMADA